MRPVDLQALGLVSDRLTPLGVRFAFTGGAVVGFLLDNPRLPFPRQTDDVDAIVEVVTRIQYTKLEAKLRTATGCRHDTAEDAPLCRWLVEGVKVDILPMRDPTGTFSDRWFEHALQTAASRTLRGVTVTTVSATCFVATKLTAFENRGHCDFSASHDLEDLLTVVDGRQALVAELAVEHSDLRHYVAKAIQGLLHTSAFRDALPGHLPPDGASQARLPLLLGRLEELAALGTR
jgi:hypothetical protein